MSGLTWYLRRADGTLKMSGCTDAASLRVTNFEAQDDELEVVNELAARLAECQKVLEQIAYLDYRGHRETGSVIAYEFLRTLRVLDSAEPREPPP